MMVECDCGEIPVVDRRRRPVGVVTDRDIVCRAVAKGENPNELKAGDVMTSPAVTVTPDHSLSACCDVLRQNQIRRVPVVDADGQCVGIVALADIAEFGSKNDTAWVVRRISEPSGAASALAP
jgi:CBS domain-containing protein